MQWLPRLPMLVSAICMDIHQLMITIIVRFVPSWIMNMQTKYWMQIFWLLGEWLEISNNTVWGHTFSNRWERWWTRTTKVSLPPYTKTIIGDLWTKSNEHPNIFPVYSSELCLAPTHNPSLKKLPNMKLLARFKLDLLSYLTIRNILSMLSMLRSMKHFGPLRNIWDGLNEKTIHRVKSLLNNHNMIGERWLRMMLNHVNKK